MKTFKEWNEKGYGRLVEEMIGYANYVHEQRNDTSEPSQPAAPINFDSGPGSLPLLPAENKGVRGSEVAKHAQEVIRAYFLRHYRECQPRQLYNSSLNEPELAMGSESARTPWATIGENPAKFFDPSCLPDGFKFQDPSRMGLSVKALLNHLRERQKDLGVKAFYFCNVLHNNKVEPANYPDQCQTILDDPTGGMVDSNAMAVDGKNKRPERAVGSPVKTSEAKVKVAADSPGPSQFTFEAVKDAIKESTNGSLPSPLNDDLPTSVIHPNVPGFYHPWPMGPHPMLPPAGLQPTSHSMGPTHGHPYHQPYPVPYDPQYMAYWNRQMGDMSYPPAAAAGHSNNRPYGLDPTLNDMDPHLLPPGAPVFSHIPPSFQPNMYNPAGPPMTVPGMPPFDTKIPVQGPSTGPAKASPKKTPNKRKRTPDDTEPNTPSRSGRRRKPSQKVLDSLP
jgi:hypothetical protein